MSESKFEDRKNVVKESDLPKNLGEPERPPIIRTGGLYAVEQYDDIPPLNQMKYLNKYGEFIDKKPVTEADLSYYYRNKLKTIGLVMLICSLGLFLTIVGASNSYLEGFFSIIFSLAGSLFAGIPFPKLF